MKKLYDITFKGTDELIKLAQQTAELLQKNVETAVVNTTLLGIARIANDCPVDTGRLQASITGDYANLAGVDLQRGKISEGKAQSVTRISGKKLEGRIGTNVEYALYQEYGAAGRQIGTASRSGATLYGRGVRGRGFFRKNIPVIENHLNQTMEEAIQATKEGRLLREGN